MTHRQHGLRRTLDAGQPSVRQLMKCRREAVLGFERQRVALRYLRQQRFAFEAPFHAQ